MRYIVYIESRMYKYKPITIYSTKKEMNYMEFL